MGVIHIAAANGQISKYDEEDVRERLVSGMLRRELLCWREGMSEWRPLGTVFGDVEIPELPPEIPPAATPNYTFIRDPAIVTQMLQVLLGLFILIGFARAISDIYDLVILSDPALTDQQTEAANARQNFLAVTFLGNYLVTGVVFLTWVFRASQNCQGFSPLPMRHSPGWSVAWFFIPIMSLFKPYQVMKEIWLVSREPSSRSRENGSPLLGWWWAFWIFTGVMTQISAQLKLRAETIPDLKNVTAVSLIQDISSITVGFLALALIRNIYRMQVDLVSGKPRGKYSPDPASLN